MPAAARINDPTNHPGLLSGPGVPNVLIEGQPAANMNAVHASFPAPAVHPPNKVAVGSPTVFIGGQPATRQGDACVCGAQIVAGAVTVEIG